MKKLQNEGVEVMSLRSLWTPLVMQSLASDRNLTGKDIQTYIHAYYNPLMSMAQLATHVGRPRQTMSGSVSRLIDAGWVYIHMNPGRTRGGLLVPWMPLQVEEKLVVLLARRRASVQFFGEWLMKNLLDLSLQHLPYYDNSHPEWLITPTGRRLQLDRWLYDHNVAFEFQGIQHFEKDNEFVRTDHDLSRQYEHDGEKIRLCSLNKVHLVEVTAADLDYLRFRSKLEGLLPLAPVYDSGPLLREVTGMCKRYTRFMAKR